MARHWKDFQDLVKKIVKSLVDISNFSTLLILIIFVFALIGMEMFAFIVYYDIEGEPVFGKDKIKAAFASG